MIELLEETGTQLGTDLYAGAAVTQAPRILGLGDRHTDSATYGCFDRPFWNYRTADLSNARFQEAAHYLALLWSCDLPGNRFAGNRLVREWAAAAVRFWANARNRDGSVNEVYPFERSYCATAFTAMAITEACRLLGLPVPERLERTAKWLARKDNPAVANQRAAAAVALYNGYEAIGDPDLKHASERLIEQLIASQAPEGYFPEYGGGDIGYQSVTLSCLCRLDRMQDNGDLSESIGRGVSWVEDRVDSKGAFSREDTSRNTQYLYPSAFVECDSPVTHRHLTGLSQDAIPSPAWMDDRYVIPLATDYLTAFEVSSVCE